MGLATETRIYKAAYQLLTKIVELVGNFPRNRRILGQRLFEDAHELVRLIFRANAAKEKVPLIQRIQEFVESIHLSLRLSSDMRLISAGQFGTTVQLIQDVGAQAGGWMKWAKDRA